MKMKIIIKKLGDTVINIYNSLKIMTIELQEIHQR